MEEVLQPPLNKAQLELLKLFSKVTSEEELNEIKMLIVNYYGQKVVDKADKVWDEKGYTQEDMERIARSES